MLEPSSSSPGVLHLTFESLALAFPPPTKIPNSSISSTSPQPPSPNILTIHTILSNGLTSTTTIPYTVPDLNLTHSFPCFIFPQTLSNLTLTSTFSYTTTDTINNTTSTITLGKLYIPSSNLHGVLTAGSKELNLFDDPNSRSYKNGTYGTLQYELVFEEVRLLGYDQDLTLEYTPATLSVYMLGHNIPSFSSPLVLRCRPVRLGKRVTSFPYHVTNPSSLNIWNEHVAVDLPLHVGKRCLIDFDVMNPVTNEVIGVGKVPVLSLSGVGRWCDVIPPLTDANDNVAKPFKGLDQNNYNSVGCVWFACGLRIKSDSETIPNPPSPSSTSSEDLAVTQPKGLENPLPPAFPPAEVSKPSETQIKGMLYIIINEGLNFPNKPKRVSYYVTLKSKSGVKAGSKPCLMGKNNTSHPIWNEHLELSEVEIGEALKVNIIDVKEEKSVNRLVGTAEIEVKDGEVVVDVELMDHNTTTQPEINSISSKSTPSVKVNLLWNPSPTTLVDFKATTFRENLARYNSLLADVPPLPAVSKKHFRFKDRPECVAFSKWSENDAFMRRSEFVDFCDDSFGLGEAAKEMILNLTKADELKVINLGEDANDIQKALNGNDCIVEMLKVLNEERDRIGVDDVGFEVFCEFHRKVGKLKGTGVGIELAGEAYMIEGLRKELTDNADIVKQIEGGIKDHREGRIVGFTEEEKEERQTESFKVGPELWSKHVERIRRDYNNLYSRFQKLDDGLSSYNDVIDGLVVDEKIIAQEAEELESTLRICSDLIFDRLEEVMMAKPVAMALGGGEDDEEIDGEIKYHRLYGSIVSTLKEFKVLKSKIKTNGNDIKAAYEFLMVDKGEEIAQDWEENLNKIGRSTVSRLRSLTNSCANLNLPTPTPLNPATWAAPPTTKNGRKLNVESMAHININDKKRKLPVGEDGQPLDSPRTRHKQIRKMRLDDAKNFMTSSNVDINWDEVDSVVSAGDTGDFTSSSFSAPVTNYSLHVYRTSTAFEAGSFREAQEVEACGGVDSYYQLQRLRGVLTEFKDVESKIVRGVLDRCVGVVETEQEGEAAKVGAGDPAAHLIRRQSLKMWKDIEAGAMSSFMPKPKFSSAEPDLNEADWMDTDQKLSKSITKSVSGLVYEEARSSVSKLSREVTPESALVLTYVFAGCSGSLGLEDIAKAIRERKEVAERREALNSEIEGKFRDSVELRHAAYNAETADSAASMHKRREVEAKKVPEKFDPVRNVPPELNEIFGMAEKYAGAEKEEKIVELLNKDFTLEGTKFKGGLTALHIAVAKSDIELIHILLGREASVEIKDYRGKRPADYTREAAVLKVLGALRTTEKPVPTRTSLKKRVLQTVNFRVSERSTQRKGVAEKYDFVSKTLYVRWGGAEKGDAKGHDVVQIHKLHLKENMTKDSYGAQDMLFKSIVDRVDAQLRMLSKKAAERITSNALQEGFRLALGFISDWQSATWEGLVEEVVKEMALEEAKDDMALAIAAHEKALEEERRRKLAEERRKEEEKQRALRFKKIVNTVATKSVLKVTEQTVPWLSTLIHYFRVFDKDDSGALSTIEVIAALRSLGISKKVQDANASITELVTKMRRHSGEITLHEFVEDMPKEVYDAIKLHGDKDKRALEERRKVMGIGNRFEESQEDRKVRFKEKGRTKKTRRRVVTKDLPPSERDECSAVLEGVLKKVVEAGDESRCLSPWFVCDVEAFYAGVDGNPVKGKVYAVTGELTVFEFLGEAVLPKPEPDVSDDKAMERFDKVLNEYGVSFDDLLDEFLGLVDVEDVESIVEACAVGLMERLNLDGRENYVEIKRKLKKALMVPLEFERLLIVMEKGHVTKVMYTQANEEKPNGGPSGAETKWDIKEYVLDNFQKRAQKDGFSFGERRSIISPRGERLKNNHRSELDSSLNDVKVICRRAGLGIGTINLLGSIYDVGLIFSEIWRFTVGFNPNRANSFAKKRSKFVHEGTTVRFQVKEESSGVISKGAVTCEGVIEAHLELTNLDYLGSGGDADFEVIDKCRGAVGNMVSSAFGLLKKADSNKSMVDSVATASGVESTSSSSSSGDEDVEEDVKKDVEEDVEKAEEGVEKVEEGVEKVEEGVEKVEKKVEEDAQKDASLKSPVDASSTTPPSTSNSPPPPSSPPMPELEDVHPLEDTENVPPQNPALNPHDKITETEKKRNRP
ncbi:hypothetical protein TrST_g2660 [Triparma strigata]|uniref:Calmodulin n=1 Tax=Triparma strigata TaxID=1606541 RepID=A0A9W7BNT2_9STRA|nr:hypothetical protein TrST_g2660 [Triparma strigata]